MNIPRKLIALLLCTLTLLPARAFPVSGVPEYHTAEENLPTVPLDIATSAGSAVLLDASGPSIRTLWAQNADKRRGPASTTKVMTALVAAEKMPLSAKITVPKEAVGIEGSSVYLTEGEVFSLEELLCCTLLESANDAATAVAIAVGGSIEGFAALMNEKCAELGLVDTHFTNPHGLDNEAHYTTAADLAKLTSYALQNPLFRKIVSTKKKEIPMNNGDGTRVLVNHNKLLRLSDDVIGVKTGFTKRSGRCLVSAAERDGVCVIAVTLNAPDDWNDHLAMHEEGFASYSSITLADIGEIEVQIPCACADGGYITATNKESLTVCVKNGAKIECIIEAYRLIIPPIIVT